MELNVDKKIEFKDKLNSYYSKNSWTTVILKESRKIKKDL
jgi:hypothetical protein